MQALATLRRETHAALCLACGKCSTMCPLAPSGWFSAARMMAVRDASDDVARQRQALEACLTCGCCEVRCPEGVHFTEFVRGVRALTPAEDRRPCPHGQLLQSAARLMAEPGAGAHTPRRDLSWLGDDLEIAERGEVALFVGCLPLFDRLFERELGLETIGIARAAIRLLNRLGIQPVVLSEERCCGHDLLWNGEREAFEALARANAEAFAARGVQTILTTCAECCRTWRLDYPGAARDFQPTVQHLSEFLAPHLESGELRPRFGRPEGTTTFQDPCRLGRHLGVTEAPRRLLRAIEERPEGQEESGFVEMELSGRDAQCCGTSGFLHCDANSRRLQSERLVSAAATGAGRLVTACPKCLIHFRCTQHENRLRRRDTPPIEVEDLTVFAESMLELTPAPATSGAEAGSSASQKGDA